MTPLGSNRYNNQVVAPLRLSAAQPKSLSLRNVSKNFGGETVLNGVSLEIGPREIICLLGNNGAGKTTLIRIASGLVRPDEGLVLIQDRMPGKGAHIAPSPLGLAPQDVSVYPTLTVRQNLEFFGGLRGLSGADLRSKMDRISEDFDLSRFSKKRVQRLSGGERRRLSTAIAFFGEPPLILLDEPTAGVDVVSRQLVIKAVQSAAARGQSILYSTHYLQEAEQLDARLVIIHKGRFVAEFATLTEATEGLNPLLELTFADTKRRPTWLSDIAFESERSVYIACQTEDMESSITRIANQAIEHGHPLVSARWIPRGLENAFLRLTAQQSFEDRSVEGPACGSD